MKEFEDYFSELQTDMVSICLEYFFERANKKIYIVHMKKVLFQMTSFIILR
ncbi:hypothetical protein BN990_02705 [Virgibacillus salexigens]|uniref:Uncharacterized protein n=1 Tax=Virgibacillus massiliensis TaxID=1462526 RepID=A0A024QCW3_9BACI|nr:hypothetical protein BN990_02705 [Virgibacillus massiliensis]